MRSIWILVTALCLICLILVAAVIYEHRVRPIVISPSLQPYTSIKQGDYLEWSQSDWSGQPGKSDVTVLFDNGISPCEEGAVVVPPAGKAGCKVVVESGIYSYSIKPGIVPPIKSPVVNPSQGGPCRPNCPPPIVVGSSKAVPAPNP